MSATLENAVLTDPNRIVSQRFNYRPSPKVIQMIDLIVDRGMRWDAAADEVGLSRPRARAVIESERVAQFIRARRKLLRATLNARIEHTIERAMTGENARTALEAVRLLIDMEKETAAKAEQARSPQQFSINIVNRILDRDVTPVVGTALDGQRVVTIDEQRVIPSDLPTNRPTSPSISPEQPAPAVRGKNPR